VAAIAAGLAHAQVEIVVVLAADLPWIAPVIRRLLTALADRPDADAAVVVDSTGRRNHLAAAWRRAALNTALNRLASAQGAAARSLFEQASVVEVADPAGDAADCDTWDDLERARVRAEPREKS
jgi:molybdopterin-guanine dinucleotide biosynthesis protein A